LKTAISGNHLATEVPDIKPFTLFISIFEKTAVKEEHVCQKLLHYMGKEWVSPNQVCSFVKHTQS
jgi:hypothetical protein